MTTDHPNWFFVHREANIPINPFFQLQPPDSDQHRINTSVTCDRRWAKIEPTVRIWLKCISTSRAPAPVLSVHQKALLTALWSIGALYSLFTPSASQQVFQLIFSWLDLHFNPGARRLLLSERGPWVPTRRCLGLCCSPPPSCLWTSPCCAPPSRG